jgi:hypothetical protein
MKFHNKQVCDIYYELFNELIIRFNCIYETKNTSYNNEYMLVPKGMFSKKTINFQYKKIDKKKLQQNYTSHKISNTVIKYTPNHSLDLNEIKPDIKKPNIFCRLFRYISSFFS